MFSFKSAAIEVLISNSMARKVQAKAPMKAMKAPAKVAKAPMKAMKAQSRNLKYDE